ncbi:MAG: HlyD family secretion protein [Chitinophagaceae bacterium]|nr:HlyD family secretion protein [Chitinophagaceae bacterium]
MPLNNQPDKINYTSLRSDEVSEIISRKPSFTERWALFIFLVILVFILIGTWFIKYPDVVQANAILTAANAPKEIVTRQEGKMVHLFVNNDDTVAQGQTIAWIESSANHKEISELSTLLESGLKFLVLNETEKVSGLFKNNFQNLGELQPSFQQFITAWQQFNDYLVNGYYYKRKQVLFSDFVYLQKMHKSLERQKALTEQDLQLTQESVDANNTLYDSKVISKQDLRDQKSKLVNKQMSLPQLESSLLSNENLQTEKQKEINELEHNISQQKIIFRQALQTLKSLTDDWEKKYIVKAATKGKIVFIIPLQENQFMQAGKTIGFVNPIASKYFAQVTLPQNNFGKIDIGQKVQLRFDAYPYQEFGVVEGRLQYISKVPSDSGFLCNIELPNGLTTNYQKQIQYRSGLKSQALVITKDLRLAQRFYYTIVKAVHQ